MAPPAARPNPQRPNFQRYTAGSCTLEVEVQPSALSQWSVRAIAQDLSFQLWLHDEAVVGSGDTVDDSTQTEPSRLEVGEDDSRCLIATGDRTDLQALAQYFHQQTRQVLAIAAIRNRNRSADAVPSPPCLQHSEPLGYIHLCDITTVIGQYEQTMRTLPVALSPALSVESAPSVTREAPLNNSNVIPLDTARRQRSPSLDRRQVARRRRTSVWASSAAAALFAVGLTTTLISRDPSLQETNVASDVVPEAQERDASVSDALSDDEPQSAARSTSPELAGELDAADSENNRGPGSTLESESLAGRNPQENVASAPVTGSQSAQSTDSIPSRRPVARPPVPDSNTDTAKLPERQSSGALGDVTTSEDEPPTVPSPSPSPAPTAGATDASPEEAAALSNSSEANSSEAPDVPEVEAVAPEASIAESLATDSDSSARRSAAQLPRIERAAPEPFSPPPDQRPAATTGGASRGQDVPSPSSDRTADLPSDSILQERNAAIVSGTALTIGQVQAYFQQRWQSREMAALVYRLQLNATGEVVSFIGLDDASQAERARILPANTPPTFDRNPQSGDSLVLRVRLMSDGTVEVTPF